MHGLQCNLNKNMIDIKVKIQVLTASAPGIINGKRASQELSFSAATVYEGKIPVSQTSGKESHVCILVLR